MKSLLAISSGGPDAEPAFQAAAQLAQAFDAHLSGLFLPPAKNALGELMGEAGEAMAMLHGGVPNVLLQAGQPRPPTRAELTRQAFEQASAALRASAFHVAPKSDADVVAAFGRLHDLMIVARPGQDPLDPEPAAINAALFETGRPLLVVPHEPFPARLGRAVVTWNGSIAATRATHFALPLLKTCEEVVVLVAESGEGDARPEVLCHYLTQHGVATRADRIDVARASSRARGRAVLHYTEHADADLLVMGAYGQGRMMQFLGLGGATAKVITACKVPLLLAH